MSLQPTTKSIQKPVNMKPHYEPTAAERSKRAVPLKSALPKKSVVAPSSIIAVSELEELRSYNRKMQNEQLEVLHEEKINPTLTFKN